jgi:hypothetical protein
MAEPANFEGHEPRNCGEHRTVGPHRAWCYDCSEWCYPGPINEAGACNGCRVPYLETELTRTEGDLAVAVAEAGQARGLHADGCIQTVTGPTEPSRRVLADRTRGDTACLTILAHG